jgi:hypothetical protein
MKGDDLSVPRSAGKLKTGSVAHISAGAGLSASHENELRERALSFSLVETIGKGCVLGKRFPLFEVLPGYGSVLDRLLWNTSRSTFGALALQGKKRVIN